MPTLTPEIVPVTSTLNTDAGVPALVRDSAGTMRIVIKDSLLKAGWTLAFEDTTAGVTVLRPNVGAETEYFLRLSEDDGRQITVQIYQNMTDINTGDLRLQCDTTFKYATAALSGRWVVHAVDRAFWVFNEVQSHFGAIPINQSGAYLFCGYLATGENGDRAIYLKHTGGTYNTNIAMREHIQATNPYKITIGKVFNPRTGEQTSVDPICFLTGIENRSADSFAFPLYVEANGEMWRLPSGALPSRNDKTNYEAIQSLDGNFMNHAMAQVTAASNLLVPTDFWTF